ncbi:MAG: isochorismate synthase [Pseudonocardia sp.]
MTTVTVRSGLQVRTRALPDYRGPLVELLPEPDGALCWVREGDGLVGWGEAVRFESEGPGRFAAADAWWRSFVGRLEIDDEVGMPGTGPVAFASFAFAAEPGGSVLVVPRVLVGRRDGVCWVTEIKDPTPRHRPAILMSPVPPAQSVRYADGELPVSQWRTAVAEAARRLRAGELDKVVLAHDLLALSDSPLDPRHLLRGLASRYPSCWSFAVDGLVGATPELLLRRSGVEITSRVLAGTIWPSEAADGELRSTLLASAKDRDEHRLALDSLGAALRPVCAELALPATPSVIELHNVLHLASDVHGTLRADDPPSLLRLVEVVHPTAAVGGTPRTEALELIGELEGMDRGRYAGPVGWVDAAGDGELGVALRCAQVSGSTARLFAGCGVMAGSDPDTEVREAAAKLVAVREALEGLR